MDQLSSILWLVLGVAFIIAEIFTLGFVLFWFGIGAIAASIAGFLGAGLGLQFLIFAVVSIAGPPTFDARRRASRRPRLGGLLNFYERRRDW